MPFLIVFLIVIAVVAIGIGVAVRRIKARLRSFSQLAFGTDSIMDGLEKQKVLEQTTPKSVSGMTSLALPRINEDFPEFDWPEWRQLCEQELTNFLEALESHNTDRLCHSMPLVIDQAVMQIENQQQQSVNEHYDDIRIHNTEIRNYQRHQGSCVIKVESAVEYRFSLSGAVQQPPQLTQTRYQMELCYIQDIDRMKESRDELGLSMHCPNCGAPVSDLGAVTCPYCGSAILPINVRSWSLLSIRKVGR
ncbi:MAG: zinc ribbon domain-containing protein [Lachnospiraceae bacterium]|nr:zinc ribbon domain-containing protein [Lachnospiraceae bacterium]MDY5742337.1 zinc ribbon domain-containing protein [Lachnospiraceae bacterium]